VGDRLVFQIHAYANGGDITGLNQKLENINNRTFLDNSSETVTAFVSASNASKISDSVRVNFTDNVKLKYYGYSLRTKLEGPNPEANEHRVDLPNGQNGASSMDSNGSQIGSLPQDNRSNLIIYFDVVEYTPSSPTEEEGDVDTNSATSVDENSARLNGDINDTDMNDV